MSRRHRLIDFGTRANLPGAGSRQPSSSRRRGSQRRARQPLLAALAGILLAVAVPAMAQIGGPIGAPVGVPNALPAGSTGYNANSQGGLAPPVNNWSASQAGRADDQRFGTGTSIRSPAPNAGYGQRTQQVPVPQYPVGAGGNGPQLAIDPRVNRPAATRTGAALRQPVPSPVPPIRHRPPARSHRRLKRAGST